MPSVFHCSQNLISLDKARDSEPEPAPTCFRAGESIPLGGSSAFFRIFSRRASQSAQLDAQFSPAKETRARGHKSLRALVSRFTPNLSLHFRNDSIKLRRLSG